MNPWKGEVEMGRCVKSLTHVSVTPNTSVKLNTVIQVRGEGIWQETVSSTEVEGEGHF